MNTNTFSQQQTENKFTQNLSYDEYLRDNPNEPTSDELNDMEKVFCKSTILKKSSLTPVNTFHHQPLQGA